MRIQNYCGEGRGDKGKRQSKQAKKVAGNQQFRR